MGHSQAWCHAGLNLLGKGKDPKRITHATVFVSKGSYQTLQTGVSPKHRAALIRSGERVSGHAAKQTQTKSAIRRLLENLSGVTDYEDRRQVEAARERAGLSKSQFTRCRRDLRESANPFIKRGRIYEFRGPRSFTHTFINREGHVQSAEVSGDNLVAMQDYRDRQPHLPFNRHRSNQSRPPSHE